MNSQYWALAPSSEIANEISNKWSDHEQWLSQTGYGYMAQTMYDLYYGLNEGGFGIDLSQDGSDAKLSVNHFKSLLQRLHSITTQSKLTYVPRARNSDAQSQMQADFAKGLLEAYGDDKNMNNITSQMVELGLVMLDSYVYAPWDKHQGETVAAGDGMQEIKNGDQSFFVLSRFDVALHPTLQTTPYYIIKLPVNKYDLAALYPDKADEITSLSLDHVRLTSSQLLTPFNQQQLQDDDCVHVYHFIHDRTPALSKGRYTLVVGKLVLEDSVLPYKTMPVVAFSGGKMLCAAAGDSPGTMLVGIQQAIDNIYSSNLSNNLHFNKQSIWSPSAVEIEKLSEGFNNIISPVQPVALQLTQSSPESYKLLQGLEGVAQTLSGINATTRGQPEASLKSGTSLSLMLAMSVASADSIQKNYIQAQSDLATIVVHNLQQFAGEKRVAYIGGVSKKAFAKEFTSEDVADIDRISVDVGNPLMSSLAGRFEMVQNWATMGIVKDPAKMVNFLRTGEVDSLTEDKFKDQLLIRSENELIRKGEVPIVAMFDIHPEHILEHKVLANDPETRSNPEIMQALLEHITSHLDNMKQMDPDLAAILQIMPLPSQQQQMQMQPPGPEGPGTTEMPPEFPGEEPIEQNLPPLPPGTPEQFQGEV